MPASGPVSMEMASMKLSNGPFNGSVPLSSQSQPRIHRNSTWLLSHMTNGQRKVGLRYSMSPPSTPTSPVAKIVRKQSSIASSNGSVQKPSSDKIMSRRQQRISTSSIFDKNDQRYRCCCGGMLHVRHAALLIGILECILTVGNLINATCLDAEYGEHAEPMRGVQTEAYLIISILGAILYVGTVAWMAYASVNRKRMKRSYMHLIPHLILQMLTIMMLCTALIILAVLAFHAKNVKVAVDAVVFALLGVGLGLEIFFFALILRCYHYLKDEYELTARAVPICVILPVHQSTSVEVPEEVMYRQANTYCNVDPNEYCVY